MKLKLNMLDQRIGLIIITVLFLMCLFIDLTNGVKLITLALLALNALSCRKNFREKFLFFAFNLAFFFFLVGRTLVAFILPELEAKSVSPIFSSETEALTDTLVFVSILVIRIVYSLAKSKPKWKFDSDVNVNYRKVLARLSRNFAYGAMLFQLLAVSEKILFVSSHGYEAYYVFFTSSFPVILSRIALLYEPLIMLHLATFPSRRATYLHLTIYFFMSATSLGYGQRNGLVLGLVFVVLYLSIRDSVTPTIRPWLSKKIILASAGLSIPFATFLAAFTFLRSKLSLPTESKVDLLANFFVSQGSGIFNLSYAIEKKELFPLFKFYSFGPIIGFFRDNIFTQLLLDVKLFQKASVELALSGHNFSFALAYLVNPYYYSRGGGFGSNYIAELWIDFGLAGVIIGSSFYGLLISKYMQLIRGSNPVTIAILFAASIQLIYAPRAGFLGFMSPVLSMSTVSAYAFLHLLARYLSNRSRRKHGSSEKVQNFIESRMNLKRNYSGGL